MNSDDCFQTPAPRLSRVTLTVWGYVPPSQNTMKGCHWAREKKERDRALRYLLGALSCASEFSPADPAIGITTESSTFRTAYATLACWMATNGISCVERSRLKRRPVIPKNELK